MEKQLWVALPKAVPGTLSAPYVCDLQETLNELAYDASIAVLEYDFYNSVSGSACHMVVG